MDVLHKFFLYQNVIYISYKSYKIKIQKMKFAVINKLTPRIYVSINFNASIQPKNATLICVHKSD